MNIVIKYLEQLGVSELEAKLYVSLLDTGPMSVRGLAESIGIKRTTAYLYIDLLIEKGLVIKIVKGAQKLVSPNPPDSLKYLVEKKLESAKLVQENFPTILKKINDLYPQVKASDEAEIKYYKGRNGVKKIYEEALKAKEFRSYVNIGLMYDNLPENSQLFAEALKNNKSLKMYELIEDSVRSREQTEFQTSNASHERYFYKFLPKEVRLHAADTLIYDGKVAIVNVGKKISGVVLHNSEYFYNSKELFDFNWRMLPEVPR